MTHKHTPTPWYAPKQDDWRHRCSVVMSKTGGKDNEGACVANCYISHVPREEAEANAAFIVKAVNNHEALVKSLESMVHAFIERNQDIYVADAVIKDLNYLRKYASDYDFVWPAHIYAAVDVLAAAKGDA